MRRLTLGLLCATYLCLSLIVSLTLWRNGGGWGASVAALVGGLGLCFAFHGLIERALETGAIKGEVEAIREAHKILLGQVETLDVRMGEIYEAAARDAHRSDVLIDEVHMLEDLVEQMRRRLDEQGDAPAFPTRLARRSARGLGVSSTTVREALTENRVDLYLQAHRRLLPRRAPSSTRSFLGVCQATRPAG